jgi:hypothetical protein
MVVALTAATHSPAAVMTAPRSLSRQIRDTGVCSISVCSFRSLPASARFAFTRLAVTAYVSARLAAQEGFDV